MARVCVKSWGALHTRGANNSASKNDNGAVWMKREKKQAAEFNALGTLCSSCRFRREDVTTRDFVCPIFTPLYYIILLSPIRRRDFSHKLPDAQAHLYSHLLFYHSLFFLFSFLLQMG